MTWKTILNRMRLTFAHKVRAWRTNLATIDWWPILLIVLTGIGIWSLIIVPDSVVNSDSELSMLPKVKKLETANEIRRTVTQIVVGLFGVAALVLTWRRVRAAEESSLTERLSKAIEQLGAVGSNGEPVLEVRIGAVYLLERAALDSPRDHWPIMEMLTAYVKHHAPTKPGQVHEPAPAEGDYSIRPRADIQAALKVLSRRKTTAARERGRTIDLSGTDLRGADLHNANLRRAVLLEVDLRGAELGSAQLQNCILAGSNLRRVDLSHANMSSALLRGAKLDYASLGDVDLTGADLSSATLRNASVFMTSLRDSHLYDSDFRKASIWTVDFSGAFVTGAHFESVDLQRVWGLDTHHPLPFYVNHRTVLPKLGSELNQVPRYALNHFAKHRPFLDGPPGIEALLRRRQ